MRKPIGGKRVNRTEDITELIVKERPDRLSGQSVLDVRDAFAYLIPDVFHHIGRRAVFDKQNNHRLPALGEALSLVEVLGLQQLALKAIGDFAVDHLGTGARPHRVNHHCPEREVRVFSLT